MSDNLFTPKLKQQEATGVVSTQTEAPTTIPSDADPMSSVLLRISRVVVIAFAFLLPVFFMPGLWASLGFQKSLLAVGAVGGVVTLTCLLMLRQKLVYTVRPIPLFLFGVFVVASLVSGLFSDSPMTALRGSVLEPGTVAFLAILFAVMAIPLLLQQSRAYTLIALQALSAGVLLVLSYVALRIVLGPIFSFQSFTSLTSSPIGSFNDLAVVAGLCVILSVIALLQLPLRLGAQSVCAVAVILSLFILTVVNFAYVWIVVGFCGLLVLLYTVSRDQLFTGVDNMSVKSSKPKPILLGVTILLCVTSALFIVLGDWMGQRVSQVVQVEYLEVRPSFTATTDIIRQIYADNALLGTGPNQFVSSWREFKNEGINETIFWSTDFNSGSSFVTTVAATTGLAGLLSFLLFQAWYVWFGIRMLFRTEETDRAWFFVGATSFAGAAFLWFMSYTYVPGVSVLLLVAFLTGLSFVAQAGLMPSSVKMTPLVTTRPRGFALMAVAILFITGSVGVLLNLSEQYAAHAAFNRVQASDASVQEIDQAALTAYGRYQDPLFLSIRAQAALVEMTELLAVIDPTEVQQQQFLSVSSRAIIAINEAITIAPHNPDYYVIQAGIYNVLARAGVPDAEERALTAITTAATLDPIDPAYDFFSAQMAIDRGDAEMVRSALTEALAKKRNFTEALFLLTQLDIAEGNTEAAIANAGAMIRLEPNNPTRYYQLGILLSSEGAFDRALAAYSTAIELDPNYANARYYRAILSAQAGDIDSALDDLRFVLETNQDNQELQALVSQLESGEIGQVPDGNESSVPVQELVPESDGDTVTTPVAPDSDLLTPLNTVPEIVEPNDSNDTSSSVDNAEALIETAQEESTTEDVEGDLTEEVE